VKRKKKEKKKVTDSIKFILYCIVTTNILKINKEEEETEFKNKRKQQIKSMWKNEIKRGKMKERLKERKR
jgi:hypothetical protein